MFSFRTKQQATDLDFPGFPGTGSGHGTSDIEITSAEQGFQETTAQFTPAFLLFALPPSCFF